MLNTAKKILLSLICFFVMPLIVQAEEIQTAEEILALAHAVNPTPCATEIFQNALYEHGDEVSVDTPEDSVRKWAHNIISGADVLERVINCPEIKDADDTKTVFFSPIVFNFGDERSITINYSTQPKVLKQKLLLAKKPSLPTDSANPKLMDPNDPAKYLNTEPAWYAVMVVQHDSLKDFVGPDKNNTLSLKYLDEHIGEIYPKGYYCTSRSAIANDKDTINRVVKKVVNLEDDSNDYYVAGDINLEWVMYAEIAADVILTVVTMGGSQALTGVLKGARAAKTAKKLLKSMKTLTKLDDVKKYMNVTRKLASHADDIAKLEKNIQHSDDYVKALKNANPKKAEEILKSAQKVNPNMTADMLKNTDKLKDTQKELKDGMKLLEKEADDLAKNSKNIQNYKETADTLNDVMKYRRELRSLMRPQTGNIIARTLKTLKAVNGGTKTLNRASKVARAGLSSRSAKIGDWLFDMTLKHGARLGRFETKVGLVYGVASFIGDMYDQTSETSKEFSNGIEFKPLCLLSADDLEGQDNVVNYGMWLMWEGNSVEPADDDAAFLQAMDFAAKFAYQLEEFQEDLPAVIDVISPLGYPVLMPRSSFLCNVDVYVVRPIIRLDETNMEDPKGEMFYLFMNETPWTTAEQFDEMVTDVKAWESDQEKLEQEDPEYKYHKKEDNNNTSQESGTTSEEEQQQPTTVEE